MKHIQLVANSKYLVIKGFQTWHHSDFKTITIKASSIIEYLGYEIKNETKYILFKDLNVDKFFNDVDIERIIPYKEGDEIPNFKDEIKYKIKFKGKFYKPKKFKDLAQVKSSLLIAFGYYDKMRINADTDKNPELAHTKIPYWFQGSEDISLEEFRDIQIVSVQGKIETVVDDFNAYEYIKESNIRLSVICKYGTVVKEMFTKIKDQPEYKYFITITPDKYSDILDNTYHEDLKELPLIKEVLSYLKSKDYKKITKYSKTAIGVKSDTILFELMNKFIGNDSITFEIFSFDSNDNSLMEYDQQARRKHTISKLLCV